MNKLFKLLFIFIFISGILNANDLFDITTEWITDSVYARRFFGAYSQKNDTSSINPYRYQGDGITTFFRTSMFQDGIKGRIGFTYNGAKTGGSFSLRIAEDTANNDPVEWSSWIRFGSSQSFSMRILAGYNEQNGLLGNFGILFPVWRKQGNYIPNNYFASTINFPYGYTEPNEDMGFVEFYMTETSDIFMPAGANIRKLLNFLMDFNFEPLTVTIASGGLYAKNTIPIVNIFNNARGEDVRGLMYDAVYNPATLGGMNYAIRAESASIDGVITIGAAYKYTSSLFTKYFPPDAPAPLNPTNIIDENKSNHAYGLYSVYTPLDIISVSFGYSGLYQTWKNPQYKNTFVSTIDIIEHEFSDYYKAIHPLFHGMDINCTYTGINKLTLSFNNNFTLAYVRGINRSEYNNGLFSLGWAYREYLGNQTGDGDGRKERYIGLVNELNFLFTLTNRTAIDATINSRLGTFTLIGFSDNKPASYSHYLNIKAGISYTIFDTPNITGVIRGGFQLRLANYIYQNAQTLDIFKAGLSEIAVPFMFSLRY